jgi:hypothetical protein
MVISIKKITELSNWKIIVVLGIATVVFYFVMAITSNLLLSKEMTKENLMAPHKVLNSQFNYSQQKAFELLQSYDKDERNVLLKFVYPIDFLIALLYGLFFTSTLIGIYKNIVKEKYLYIFLFPMIAPLCAIFENLLIIYMLNNLNIGTVQHIAPITNVFTMIKLILLPIYIISLCIGLLIQLIKKMMKLQTKIKNN